MTTVNLSLLAGAGWQFFDNNGIPLSGGLIYTYAAGTNTPQATYTTNAGTIANSNPIVLDSAGRVNEVWTVEGQTYKFVLTTATGTLIGTYDNIVGANDFSAILALLANTTDVTKGDALIGFLQSNVNGAYPNAVGKTVHQKLQEFVSVMDFIPTGTSTDVVDCSDYINAAINSGAQNVYFPQNIYAISKPILLKPYTQLIGVDGGNTSGASNSRVIALAPFVGDSMVESTDVVDSSNEKRYGLKNMFFNGANLVKNGVMWENANSGQIINVTVVNVREYGFKIVNGVTGFSSNVTMTNCYVRMPSDQYFIDPVTYPIYAAYYLEGVLHLLTNCLSDGGVTGLTLGNNVLTAGNTIQNCHFEGWTKYGIQMSDVNGRNKILGNNIISIYTNSNPYGIYEQVGIYLNPTSTAGSNIIANNVIENSNNGATYVVLSYGILATIYSANNLIEGNVIRNWLTGVNVSGSFNTFSNNSVQITKWVYVIASGQSTVINGGFCSFTDPAGYLVEDTSGAANFVSNLVTVNNTYQVYSGTTSNSYPPAFSAYQTVAQTIANATPTTLVFNVEEFDIYNNYSTSTGIFSSPRSGYYQVTAGMETTATTTGVTLAIYVQGVENKKNHNTDATSTMTIVSGLVYLQKGWSLQIVVTLVGPKTTQTGISSTWFSGVYVSQPF